MQQQQQQLSSGERAKAREAWGSAMPDRNAGAVYSANSAKMRQAVEHWARTTSMHGIGKLAEDEAEAPFSAMRRLVWTALLLCASGLFAYQISQLAVKFSQFPVSTRSYEEDVSSLSFPAVSICPINGLSARRLSANMDALTRVAGHIFSAAPPTASGSANSSAPAAANISCEEKWRQTASNVPSKDNFLMGSFYMGMNQLNDSMLGLTAVRLPEILLDCSYMGMQCTPKDFVTFRNSAFGYCHAINFNGSWTAASYGPMNSLQMTLALNQSDYVENGYGDAGYRILIHEPRTYPFAEAAGYHLSPGSSVQIGLEFHQTDRVPPPYSDCRNYTEAENQLLNAYTNASIGQLAGAGVGYSHQACMRTCKQEAAIRTCGCFIPCSYASNEQRDSLRPCEIRSAMLAGNRSCYELLMNSSDQCSQRCKFACSRRVYPVAISNGQFPALSYLNRLIELANASGYAADITKATGGLMNYTRNSFLRVSVFAEEMKVHRIEDSPSYQLKDLLSDCGGQGGFWLGLSILTLFELADMLSQLFGSCCRAIGK